MSLSDCSKCWDTPCTCGEMYKSWSDADIQTLICTLEKVLADRPPPTENETLVIAVLRAKMRMMYADELYEEIGESYLEISLKKFKKLLKKMARAGRITQSESPNGWLIYQYVLSKEEYDEIASK